MRYEVDTGTVDDAAATADWALARLTVVRPDLAVEPVGVALAGGMLAASVSRISLAWRERLREARVELLGLGSALQEASRLYSAVEHAAARAFTNPSGDGAP
jgi:hypothetical protein